MMLNNKLKLFWSRLKHNHLLLMVLCCLVLIGLVAGFFYLFGGGGTGWVWLIVLLCLPLHIWMMRSHGHDGCGDDKDSEPASKKLDGGK